MLQRDASVPVALVLFDVLEIDGETTMRLPYLERRELLESLTFGLGCHVCARFDDGAALWRSVVDHRLEGVVAKAAERALPAWRAKLGQAQESGLAAVRG